jgi:predicted HicB family RNase H-like nuclease
MTDPQGDERSGGEPPDDRSSGEGRPSGKEPTTRFTVDLPDSLHYRFKVQAAKEGRSMKAVMIEALSQYLDEAS